ncbi:MAG: hypothetical protein ACAH80_06740 [Alphaproteobacteria bacterium]
MASQNAKTAALLVVAVIVAVVAYTAMTTRENRTLGEKIDSAVSKLDSGVDDAARELKDRTPAEKVRDEIKDATDGNSR